VRDVIRNRFQSAFTIGYGPRFLHSTGQLHKGGPNSGVFLQLTDVPSEAIPVPEKSYSFKELIKAQAEGDYQALKNRERRIIRINLGDNAPAKLSDLKKLLTQAIG
jgi:transaldolase/glucose-6-phosphate isomerase